VQQESAAGEKKIHELGIKIGEQIQSDIGDISKKMAAHGRAPAAKEIDSFARKIDRLEAMLESLNKKLGRLDDYIAKELSEIDNRMSKVEDFCEEERKAGQKIGIYEDVQKILSSK
jgi:cob(I)alamin adenosyltransferase